MNKSLLVLLFFCCTACANKKKEVLDHFFVMYDEILELDISSINNFLNQHSKAFIKDLTQIESFDLETVTTFGKKYNIEDLMVDYVRLHRKELEKNNSDTAFYTFLGLNQVPLFNFYNLYDVNEERSRFEPDIHIAMTKSEHGNKYLNWVRLEEEDGKLTLDLLYTLKLHNKKTRTFFESLTNDYGLNTREELYAKLWEVDESVEYDVEYINHQISRRNDMMAQRKNQ